VHVFFVQVMLINGGQALEDDEKVHVYSAGTETNPIYVFDKSAIENLSLPETSPLQIPPGANTHWIVKSVLILRYLKMKSMGMCRSKRNWSLILLDWVQSILRQEIWRFGCSSHTSKFVKIWHIWAVLGNFQDNRNIF